MAKQQSNKVQPNDEDSGFVPRTVFFNNAEQNAETKYRDNSVSTTKYNVASFIPKNLGEQFRRTANLYFLLIAILSFQDFSPIKPYTSVSPLVFVLALQATKDGLEDWKRAKQDKHINGSYTTAVRGGEEVQIEWRHVVVGDIVIVKNREFIPADLVLLSSSENQSMAYIETSNLDGETNLKIRQALPETAEHTTVEQIAKLEGRVECENPNKLLYRFEGTLHAGHQSYSLSVLQFLPRGTQLRNTARAYGLVVFTGHESKVMMNAGLPPYKRSNIEIKMNSHVTGVFIMLIVICITCAIGASVSTEWFGSDHWYLGLQWADAQFDPANVALVGFINFWTNLILFNVLIPISLYVSVEFVKLALSYYVNHDKDMYHEETDTWAAARTSSLIEELGQIQFVFSDKTGTLTCNSMEFMKCSIAGTIYGSGVTEIERASAKRQGKQVREEAHYIPSPEDGFDKGFTFWDDRIMKGEWVNEPIANKIEEFFLMLALCHEVVPETDSSGKVIYQSSSPDEGALVLAAKNIGFYFSSKTPTTYTVTDTRNNQESTYEILNVLEFNSTRKRMSVVVRDPHGKITMYCKGADTVIYERVEKSGELNDKTSEDLELFAAQGLRTLCLAKKDLSEDEYTTWSKLYHEAETTLVGRQEKVDAAAEELEKNLVLIGATAIEDKLQKGVPECIADLAVAGIQIWVLTGDRQETAINIGFACSLLTNEMDLNILLGRSPEQCVNEIERLTRHCDASDKEQALVVDGKTLEHCLTDQAQLAFLELGIKCKAVVCCRVSPAQKGEVTSLVRTHANKITLAIGDGANDVSMIQKAHIGVGISGNEGMQAVMASDFAIAQFRFLSKLTLVHGYWSYKRISKLVCYFFYKNIAFAVTILWFSMFTGFSGQRMYDEWYQSFYNMIFTALPVVFYAALEQEVSARSLLQNPKLYLAGQADASFKGSVFVAWVLEGFAHSLLVYFVCHLTFAESILDSDGKEVGVWAFGNCIFTVVLVVVTLRIAFETSFFPVAVPVIMVGSLAVWFIFNFSYSAITPGAMFGAFDEDDNIFGTAEMANGFPHFWGATFLAIGVTMLPQLAVKHCRRFFAPFAWQIIQEGERLESRNRQEWSTVPTKENKRQETQMSLGPLEPDTPPRVKGIDRPPSVSDCDVIEV